MKKSKKNNNVSATSTCNKKWTAKKVFRKIGKIILGTGTCILVTEGTFIAANAAAEDFKGLYKITTYKNRPVEIKTGKIFKKTKTVVINPITGAMTPYNNGKNGKKVK